MFLNILTSTLSRNSVQVIFISCMNRAIEKCANRLLKTHKIKVVFFPLYLKRMTFTIYPQTFFLIFLHRFVLFCFISFRFFSVAPFSHKRSASIKIPFLQKLFGASNNLGVHPFPSPIDHFGVLTSPYRLKKGVLDLWIYSFHRAQLVITMFLKFENWRKKIIFHIFLVNKSVPFFFEVP